MNTVEESLLKAALVVNHYNKMQLPQPAPDATKFVAATNIGTSILTDFQHFFGHLFPEMLEESRKMYLAEKANPKEPQYDV